MPPSPPDRRRGALCRNPCEHTITNIPHIPTPPESSAQKGAAEHGVPRGWQSMQINGGDVSNEMRAKRQSDLRLLLYYHPLCHVPHSLTR